MSNSVLKPGWEWVKFGDVVRKVSVKADPQTSGLERYVAGEHMDTDDLRLRRWGEISDNYLGPAFQMHFKPGQVLYGSRRTYLRKIAVPDFEGICANTTFVLESKDPNVLLLELLPFIMQTEAFHEHSISQSKGSVNPYVNFSDLAWYEFALPPLETQKRMLSLLEVSEKYRKELSELAAQTETLWQATAAEMFHSDLHSDVSKAKVLGGLLSYASDGPFGSKLKTEHYQDEGVRVVRLQNIEELSFNYADEAYISESYFNNELLSYSVKPGDVLIAGLGDESVKVGRACLAPQDLKRSVNKADCFCLRTSSEINPDYLVYFLNSVYGLRQAKSFAQGTTRLRLNLGNIKKMLVPVPNSPRQTEVVGFLSKLRSLNKFQEERTGEHKSFNELVRTEISEGIYV